MLLSNVLKFEVQVAIAICLNYVKLCNSLIIRDYPLFSGHPIVETSNTKTVDKKGCLDSFISYESFKLKKYSTLEWILVENIWLFNAFPTIFHSTKSCFKCGNNNHSFLECLKKIKILQNPILYNLQQFFVFFTFISCCVCITHKYFVCITQ